MQSPPQASIVLADDHPGFIAACRQLLEPEFDVVSEAYGGQDALDAVALHDPDVLVLDISMPRLNGIDAARQLKEILPEVALVVVTMHKDPGTAAEARRAGAAGFVTKSAASSELGDAVASVLKGETYLTPLIDREQVDALLRRSQKRSGARLTPRQREVLQLLAEGLVMKQVARELGLSTRTVAHHKYKIMKEQGIDSNAGLVQLAIEERLIARPDNP